MCQKTFLILIAFTCLLLMNKVNFQLIHLLLFRLIGRVSVFLLLAFFWYIFRFSYLPGCKNVGQKVIICCFPVCKISIFMMDISMKKLRFSILWRYVWRFPRRLFIPRSNPRGFRTDLVEKIEQIFKHTILWGRWMGLTNT